MDQSLSSSTGSAPTRSGQRCTAGPPADMEDSASCKDIDSMENHSEEQSSSSDEEQEGVDLSLQSGANYRARFMTRPRNFARMRNHIGSKQAGSSNSGQKRKPENSLLEEPHEKNQRRMDDEETSGAAAAASSFSSLAPAQRLYHDGLHSIFKFLPLKTELLSSICTCRSWRDAAYKEPSRKLSLRVDPAYFPALCSSPLRGHLSDVDSTGSACSLADVCFLASLPSLTSFAVNIDGTSLIRIRAALPTQTHCEEAAAHMAAKWPPTLERIRIHVDKEHKTNEDQTSPTQMLIELIGRLPSLTKVVLSLDSPGSTFDLNLAPLQRLPQLTDLVCTGMKIGQTQLFQIKQISTLDWFQPNLSGNWSVQQLQLLCTPPHQLHKLQQLALRGTDLTAAHMKYLLYLPSLTLLRPKTFTEDALPFLSQLAALREMRIEVTGDERTPAAVFLPQLKRCVQLSTLSLTGCSVTKEEMYELLAALPLLWSLGLEDVNSLLDLRCLAAAPSLRELVIKGCSMRSLQLLQLIPCKSLRTLKVELPEEDVQLARQQFQPPSAHLPQLTELSISATRV